MASRRSPGRRQPKLLQPLLLQQHKDTGHTDDTFFVPRRKSRGLERSSVPVGESNGPYGAGLVADLPAASGEGGRGTGDLCGVGVASIARVKASVISSDVSDTIYEEWSYPLSSVLYPPRPSEVEFSAGESDHSCEGTTRNEVKCSNRSSVLNSSDTSVLVARYSEETSGSNATSTMVLVSSTARADPDEFCDINLDNTGPDIKDGKGVTENTKGPWGTALSRRFNSDNKNVYTNLSDKITSDYGSYQSYHDHSDAAQLPTFEMCPENRGSSETKEQSDAQDYPPRRHRALSRLSDYGRHIDRPPSPCASISPPDSAHYLGPFHMSGDTGWEESDISRTDGSTHRSYRHRHSICDGNLMSSSISRKYGHSRKSSLVEDLLVSIYRARGSELGSSSALADSDTLTEYSTTSEIHYFRRSPTPNYEYESETSVGRKGGGGHRLSHLQHKDVNELGLLISSLRSALNSYGAMVVRELKKREKLRQRRERQNDVITAILHALSPKRRQDTRMRFSVTPQPGDSGFAQWHDAMMMCARLPGGIPHEFRRRLWLTLAEKHLQARDIEWNQAQRFCFNDTSNPDDDEIGDQIVKDLARTGCPLFCGEEAEDNQAMLQRVLLAYARWNKQVGYCQGFNMLAAIILEVMERHEGNSLKVMIYLIEGVLPDSYFANNLRGLSVDMAVFRDLLKLRLPQLSRHLEALQHDAADGLTGACYEPPLTNVFTMQWFLTLFSNCLPRETVMRVWDLTFLQGDEVLLRTALAIWDGLAGRILEVTSADEFYTAMGMFTREMLTPGIVDPNKLVQTIVAISAFPLPGLVEMRDKYTYNITPWTQSVSSVAKRGIKLFYSDEDEEEYEDEDTKIAVATAFGFSGIFRKSSDHGRGHSPNRDKLSVQQSPSSRHSDHRENMRPNLDISALKKQYSRLRERQKQAHIILTSSQLRTARSFGELTSNSGNSNNQRTTPLTMNHLLRGKKALQSRTRRTTTQGIIPSIPGVKKKIERKLSDTTGLHSKHKQQQKIHQEKIHHQRLQINQTELNKNRQQQTKEHIYQQNQNKKQPQKGNKEQICEYSKQEVNKQEQHKQNSKNKHFQRQIDPQQAQKRISENQHGSQKSLKRTTTPLERSPIKTETLLWKNADKHSRRLSLPAGVKLLGSAQVCLPEPGDVEECVIDSSTLGDVEECVIDSSTSTSLCDDDEDDRISELEHDNAEHLVETSQHDKASANSEKVPKLQQDLQELQTTSSTDLRNKEESKCQSIKDDLKDAHVTSDTVVDKDLTERRLNSPEREIVDDRNCTKQHILLENSYNTLMSEETNVPIQSEQILSKNTDCDDNSDKIISKENVIPTSAIDDYKMSLKVLDTSRLLLEGVLGNCEENKKELQSVQYGDNKQAISTYDDKSVNSFEVEDSILSSKQDHGLIVKRSLELSHSNPITEKDFQGKNEFYALLAEIPKEKENINDTNVSPNQKSFKIQSESKNVDDSSKIVDTASKIEEIADDVSKIVDDALKIEEIADDNSKIVDEESKIEEIIDDASLTADIISKIVDTSKLVDDAPKTVDSLKKDDDLSKKVVDPTFKTNDVSQSNDLLNLDGTTIDHLKSADSIKILSTENILLTDKNISVTPKEELYPHDSNLKAHIEERNNDMDNVDNKLILSVESETQLEDLNGTKEMDNEKVKFPPNVKSEPDKEATIFNNLIDDQNIVLSDTDNAENLSILPLNENKLRADCNTEKDNILTEKNSASLLDPCFDSSSTINELSLYAVETNSFNLSENVCSLKTEQIQSNDLHYLSSVDNDISSKSDQMESTAIMHLESDEFICKYGITNPLFENLDNNTNETYSPSLFDHSGMLFNASKSSSVSNTESNTLYSASSLDAGDTSDTSDSIISRLNLEDISKDILSQDLLTGADFLKAVLTPDGDQVAPDIKFDFLKKKFAMTTDYTTARTCGTHEVSSTYKSSIMFSALNPNFTDSSMLSPSNETSFEGLTFADIQKSEILAASRSPSLSPSPKSSPDKFSPSPNVSPSRSPCRSPSRINRISWGISTLPTIPSPPDGTDENFIDLPKSPKIVVEDESKNIFEMYSGYDKNQTESGIKTISENQGSFYKSLQSQQQIDDYVAKRLSNFSFTDQILENRSKEIKNSASILSKSRLLRSESNGDQIEILPFKKKSDETNNRKFDTNDKSIDLVEKKAGTIELKMNSVPKALCCDQSTGTDDLITNLHESAQLNMTEPAMVDECLQTEKNDDILLSEISDLINKPILNTENLKNRLEIDKSMQHNRSLDDLHITSSKSEIDPSCSTNFSVLDFREHSNKNKGNDPNQGSLENETDVFSHESKDLSSVAIRKRLWHGVRSISVDADVSLVPDILRYSQYGAVMNIEDEISAHRMVRSESDDTGKKTHNTRKNSEGALHDLVKENTEIIDRVKQNTVDNASAMYIIKETDTPVNTPVDENFDINSDWLFTKKHSNGMESHDQNINPISPLRSFSRASSNSSEGKACSSDSNKSNKQFKSLSRSSSLSLDVPLRPLVFNPFPTRSISRQPKDVALKLGLYSPTKSSNDCSPSSKSPVTKSFAALTS